MWSFLSGCVINPLRYPTRRGVARTGLGGGGPTVANVSDGGPTLGPPQQIDIMSRP